MFFGKHSHECSQQSYDSVFTHFKRQYCRLLHSNKRWKMEVQTTRRVVQQWEWESVASPNNRDSKENGCVVQLLLAWVARPNIVERTAVILFPCLIAQCGVTHGHYWLLWQVATSVCILQKKKKFTTISFNCWFTDFAYYENGSNMVCATYNRWRCNLFPVEKF